MLSIDQCSADSGLVRSGLNGGQVGVNAQFDNFVLGVEGDVYWSNLAGGMSYDSPQPFTGEVDIDATIDWTASLRARAGVAFDGVLLYGTAGLAAAKISSTEVIEVVGAGGFDGDYPASQSAVHYGYAVGVGAEVMVTENVSLRGQYMYSNFGSADHIYEHEGIVGTVESEAVFDTHAVTVGFNVHF